VARDLFLPWASCGPPRPPAPTQRLLAPPSLPEEDRTLVDPEHLLAAAVALDVLRTGTRALVAAPSILSDLAAVLLRLGTLSGMDAQRQTTLMSHAAGEIGEKRQRLCGHLAARARALAPGRRTDPAAVERAVREIERGAELVIRDARLLVESQAATTYRPA
jgi:hypothetical protein